MSAAIETALLANGLIYHRHNNLRVRLNFSDIKFFFSFPFCKHFINGGRLYKLSLSLNK